MIVGVSRALKEAGCKARMWRSSLQPRRCSPRGKEAAPRRRDRRRIPAAAPEDGEYDEVRTVEETAAREMARRWRRRKESSRARRPD